MHPFLNARQRTLLIAILAFTLFVRLFTLGAYPLADMTEGRYAEVARKMDETDNWVTPQVDYGVPFWAKPPLSTWLTALSFRLFGVSEFTARLSPFFLMLALCWLTYSLALRERGRDHALMSAVVAATAGLTFITAGAVMTDAALGLSTTVSMVAFWRAYATRSRPWGYVFFVGLAAGLLTKGLVPFVLTLLPIGIWIVWKRQWRAVWERLPWLTGSLLMLALTVPWYLMAELRTPGFLDYFFLGEHWKKFTESGWKGDLYGTAHNKPRGTIWLYWLVSDLPWSLVFIATLITRALRRRPGEPVIPRDDWTTYLISWALSPMLFFTLAGNIMLTYVLTGVPAFAVLFADFWAARASTPDTPSAASGRGLFWPALGLITPLLFLAMIATVGPELVSRKSQKAVVEKYESLRTDPAARLVYVYKRPHSAEFYTRGKAEQSSPEQMENYFSNGRQDFFVFRSDDLARIPAPARDKIEPVWQYQNLTLMRERTAS